MNFIFHLFAAIAFVVRYATLLGMHSLYSRLKGGKATGRAIQKNVGDFLTSPSIRKKEDSDF